MFVLFKKIFQNVFEEIMKMYLNSLSVKQIFFKMFFSLCLQVMLQGPASRPFTGFLLQAKAVGGRFPLGFFALTSTATQLLTCNHRPVIILSCIFF